MGFRRNALVLMVALLVALAVGCSGKRATLNTAEHRVQMMLTNMDRGSGTDGDIQTATCLWYANKIVITDSVALNRAIDGFDLWRIEKGMYKGIGSFEVLGAYFDGDPADKVVIVRTTIDGEHYSMRVPHEQPISWVD